MKSIREQIFEGKASVGSKVGGGLAIGAGLTASGVTKAAEISANHQTGGLYGISRKFGMSSPETEAIDAGKYGGLGLAGLGLGSIIVSKLSNRKKERK